MKAIALATLSMLATTSWACNADPSPPRDGVAIPIINGEPANDGAAVYIVWITENGQEGFCSGSVIKKRIVMTSAHCVVADATRTVVVFGDSITTASTDPQIDVIRTLVHPGYSADVGYVHDIALLNLASDAPVTPFKVNFNRTKPGLGDDIRLVGFGDRDPGEAVVIGERYQGMGFVSAIDPRGGMQIAPNNSTTLPGDSGGPSFLADDNQLVVGVNSQYQTDINGQPVASISTLTSYNQPFIIGAYLEFADFSEPPFDIEEEPEEPSEEPPANDEETDETTGQNEDSDGCGGIDYEGICCDSSGPAEICNGIEGWVVWCERGELLGQPCDSCSVYDGFADCS